ncbi:MAG: YybH family protein [Solirubrobacteraceae bacterium]
MIATEQTQDEAQIRQLLADRETAMRERDAELLVGHYGPEAVQFDLAPPLQHTGPELRDPAGLQAWFSGLGEGGIDYEIADLTVTAGEDVAFCHSLNRLGATPDGSSEPFEMWFRATVCLRKVDGAWQITHEHSSTPFYMDGSFKAALDLKP